MANVKASLAVVVADYGLGRAWVAAHPVLAVLGAMLFGLVVGHFV